jgi:hypothetical protein
MNGKGSCKHINGRGDNQERVAILDAGAQYGKVEHQTMTSIIMFIGDCTFTMNKTLV